MPVPQNALLLISAALLVLVAALEPEMMLYLAPLGCGALALMLLRARSASAAKDTDS